ncbi:MAG: hypothetical protein JNM25_10060 [Planctomycetes bacterium]|nr:hypothetical protein [Planctomycetota bacterium]
MNAADFDRRVHACFDARRDPLDDAEVCAFLAAHPQRLPAFARLRETLRRLPEVAPRTRRHRRSAGWLAGMAVAAAAAIAVAVAWPRVRAAGTAPRPVIFGAELREIRPRAYAAVQYSLRQRLVVSATTTLETYERRSQRR